MEALTVGAGLARGLVAIAVKKGARAEDLAERARVSLTDLQDQDNRIAMQTYIALMRQRRWVTPSSR